MHSGFGKSVTFFNPAGNVAQTVYTPSAEVIGQNDRGSNAVHVVIAKDGNGFAVLHSLFHALDSAVHVAHEQGRDGQCIFAFQHGGGVFRCDNAPVNQNARKQTGISGFPECRNVQRIRHTDFP